MKHIYTSALNLVSRRIKSCGKALSTVSDGDSLTYWQKELNKANSLKSRIEDRLDMDHNVIYVDFNAKKRVA